MDGIKFKKFKRGFIFGARHFPPSFLWWKNLYILIFGLKMFSKISKGPPPYDLAHFSNFQPNPNLKNEPNHKGTL